MKWFVLGYQSPFPGAGGATPGYLLEVDSFRLLIDCGSGVLAQLARLIKPFQIDAVILSHLHHDHIADFFVLQYATMLADLNGWRQKALPVWAPSTPQHWYERLPYGKWIDLHPIEGEGERQIGPISVTLYRTDHAIPCYAMRLEHSSKVILYGADAGPKTDWKRMAISPDLFVCEATFLEENRPVRLAGHLTAALAGQAAQQINAHRLLLTHLYPEYDPNQVQQEAAQFFTKRRIAVAEIGWDIEL